MCKEFGGLGIPNLRDLNICLLASWLRRYQLDGDKLWKTLLNHKYDTDRPNILCTRSNEASQFFRGIMWAAEAARMGFRWKVGDGRKVRFWEDHWLGATSSYTVLGVVCFGQ